MRNLSVLFKMSKTAGPMIVGILKYVSVEVKAMKKKLTNKSKKHIKLNKKKLINSFLCSPILFQIRSLGYCAQRTIILESATFQVAY